MNYQDISLTKSQLSSLRSIAENDFSVPRQDINFLIDAKLIYLATLPTDQNPQYRLTTPGQMFLQKKEADGISSIKHWFADKLIDILALIVAVIALIRTF